MKTIFLVLSALFSAWFLFALLEFFGAAQDFAFLKSEIFRIGGLILFVLTLITIVILIQENKYGTTDNV